MKVPAFVEKFSGYRTLIVLLKRIHFTQKNVNLYVFLIVLRKELARHGLVDRAKAMAFSFMLAMFPAIIFVFTLIPYIPIEHLDQRIIDTMKDLLPLSIFDMVEDTILEIVKIPRGGLMSLGFIMALYSGTNGIRAMIDAFNECYHFRDKRKFWGKIWVSITIMLLILIVAVFTIGTNIYFSYMLQNLTLAERFDDWILIGFKDIILILVTYFSISYIYFIAPAQHKRFDFFSMGSFIATTFIFMFTFTFTFYVNNFNSYNKVYGSIGALIGLMLWYYVISLVLLIGFEFNRCIDLSSRVYYHRKLLDKR